MLKTIIGPIIGIAICILSTQSIAYAVSIDNSLTFNYIALLTIGLQWMCFIHASGLFGNERTEKYYDLMGSATYIMAIIINSSISKHYSMRIALLNLLVLLWTLRLGTFLFIRIKRNKGIDSRFAEFKINNYRFLMVWTLQGVWVFIVLLPLLIITQREVNFQFKALDYIGCMFFICGLLLEAIADYQKFKFASESKNKGKFISSGLWKYSRHTNYFGEILLWSSIAVIAYSGTQSYLVFISPAFVATLLVFGSGIPILEKNADAKFVKDEKYQIYKKLTPVLVPFIGRAGNAMF
ncbi:uncharacterized protein [Chironomus tepperi]|uniref:uncharacterized protein n=1 Tax=Chironomus tepperi TaxID=113505 RepID=UPI00391F6EB0